MEPFIQHNVNLQDYCTFKIGGVAANFAHIKSRQELIEACDWAAEEKLPIFVLGEGSNLIFTDKGTKTLIMKMEILGYELVAETEDSTTLKIGAGEHWDSVVGRTVSEGLAGIETMSMIPGTVGGTPVQNVGAYGQEIKDTLVELEAFDTRTGQFVNLSNPECGFGYRSSIFNTTERGRYIICSITLKLSKNPPRLTGYESLKAYLDKHHITEPTLIQIRQAVMTVRAERLPDPDIVPNVGSFFSNPLVSQKQADELKINYPDLPTFPATTGKVKLAAGWLIEQSGFKGKKVGKLQIFAHHAQVLTNPNHASFADLEKAVVQITTAVQKQFGITLEREPEIVE